MSSLSTGQQQALAAFAVIAVLAIFYVMLSGNSDSGVACASTAAGVAIVADGLRKQQSAAAIVAAAGAEFILVDKCEDWVKTLVDDPTKETKVEVQSDSGEDQTAETSGIDLSEPPPRPAAGSLGRRIECLGWGTELLYDWCVNGSLGPPEHPF
jgi:hypothetical protein